MQKTTVVRSENVAGQTKRFGALSAFPPPSEERTANDLSGRHCRPETATTVISDIRKGGVMVKQESEGKIDKLKGRLKEAAGIVTGDRALERQGAQQRAKGAVEESLGRARRKVGEAVDEVARAIKK
jgi:uncharacterized protein YjbJ (UPF0337 family)